MGHTQPMLNEAVPGDGITHLCQVLGWAELICGGNKSRKPEEGELSLVWKGHEELSRVRFTLGRSLKFGYQVICKFPLTQEK